MTTPTKEECPHQMCDGSGLVWESEGWACCMCEDTKQQQRNKRRADNNEEKT